MASLCFAIVGVMVRLMKNEYTSIEFVFYRNAIGVPILIYFLLKNRPEKKIGGKLFLLFFRGFIGTLALYFFFYGVTTLGLPEAITYQQSYPILLAVISAILLKEKINGMSWLAIIIGFVGLCLIFVPKMSSHPTTLKSHIIGILNPVLTGLAYLSIRGLTKYYDNKIIVLSFMICGTIFPIISLWVGSHFGIEGYEYIFSKFHGLHIKHLPYMTVFGTVALLGQNFLTKAFNHKNTGLIGAMGYTNVVFSIILGVMAGDLFPDKLTLIGIMTIMISGVIISLNKVVST